MSKQVAVGGPFRIAVACLAISVGVNILTTIQLSRVRVRPRGSGLAIGQRVRPVTLVSDRAERVDIRFSEEPLPTLFYWFSPTCGWCELNLANFQALAAQAKGKYRFVPLAVASPAELAGYAERYKLTLPLYTISEVGSHGYHFAGTPTSLLVSQKGIVLGSWYGAYTPSTLIEVEKALGISLPGIVPVAEVVLK